MPFLFCSDTNIRGTVDLSFYLFDKCQLVDCRKRNEFNVRNKINRKDKNNSIKWSALCMLLPACAICMQSPSTEMMFVAHIKFMAIFCQYLYSADLCCSFWCTFALTNILYCEKRQVIFESWIYHSKLSIEAAYNIIWRENKIRVSSGFQSLYMYTVCE